MTTKVSYPDRSNRPAKLVARYVALEFAYPFKDQASKGEQNQERKQKGAELSNSPIKR